MLQARLSKIIVALICVVPVLSSCGGEEASESQVASSALQLVTSCSPPPSTTEGEVNNTDLSIKPSIQTPSEPPVGLEVEDIVEGSGPQASAGSFLVMQYVGVSCSTGLQFDASWDRGQPFSFELGAGKVIKGWDEGIVGMAVGGRRLLTIPPGKAYGSSGSGSGSIGPNETLLFIVDLLALVPTNLDKPSVSVPDEPASELVITDITEGEGPEVQSGDIVYVHYVGYSQSTNTQFDASWDRGREQYIIFPLGQATVIDGWEEGLLGMKVGGRRELVIPPDLAYGQDGAGEGIIAPNETLVFVVDLLGANAFLN
tara:strand:+ start:1317 stop:2258 length:942 start_codon:yes stop_codon:yes gene_type:complete